MLGIKIESKSERFCQNLGSEILNYVAGTKFQNTSYLGDSNKVNKVKLVFDFIAVVINEKF